MLRFTLRDAQSYVCDSVNRHKQSGGEQATVITGNRVQHEKNKPRSTYKDTARGTHNRLYRLSSANGFANMPKVNRKTWTEVRCASIQEPWNSIYSRLRVVKAEVRETELPTLNGAYFVHSCAVSSIGKCVHISSQCVPNRNVQSPVDIEAVPESEEHCVIARGLMNSGINYRYN